AITAIIDLEDKSYNVAPEVTFTGITNFELRAKINVLNGDDHSEFGEKQNDSKVEIRLRYYF
ncbi:MAG: hypothetical protein PVF34_01490, partial [Gammaproteobacteria bacterium]